LSSRSTTIWNMAPIIDTEDLIDATTVATIVGLSRRTSVSVYQLRYADMPRPLIEQGTCRLWSRPAIEEWTRSRPGARGKVAEMSALIDRVRQIFAERQAAYAAHDFQKVRALIAEEKAARAVLGTEYPTVFEPSVEEDGGGGSAKSVSFVDGNGVARRFPVRDDDVLIRADMVTGPRADPVLEWIRFEAAAGDGYGAGGQPIKTLPLRLWIERFGAGE
jgi:hypothetical protein